VNRLVVDAPVIASWFDPDGDGRSLRGDYEAGGLAVIGPRHLPQDVLAELAREHGLEPERLGPVAVEVARLRFELQEPSLGGMARWIGRGLPAHRAAYVALAHDLDLALVTDDDELHRLTPAARRPRDA